MVLQCHFFPISRHRDALAPTMPRMAGLQTSGKYLPEAAGFALRLAGEDACRAKLSTLPVELQENLFGNQFRLQAARLSEFHGRTPQPDSSSGHAVNGTQPVR